MAFRSLFLRAKRPLQQQLRKMNETALERTELCLRGQEDKTRLSQQDFLRDIYSKDFYLKRQQIHSSLSAEKSLQSRRDALQTALLVSSSLPSQEAIDSAQEFNPLTSENFSDTNFPATFTFEAHASFGGSGFELEVDSNGKMSLAGTEKSDPLQERLEPDEFQDSVVKPDELLATLTKTRIEGFERSADGTVTDYHQTDAWNCQRQRAVCHVCMHSVFRIAFLFVFK